MEIHLSGQDIAGIIAATLASVSVLVLAVTLLILACRGRD